MPDFQTFGSLLRDAFAEHGVTVKRIVLAMHGNISRSIEMNWGSSGNNVLEHTMLERDQFEDADAIYAISPRYIHEWQSISKREIRYIDPINFVASCDDRGSWKATSSAKASIYCIGRCERRKGNDLFVEMVRWLPSASYREAAHIGDEDYSQAGIASSQLLADIATKREISIAYRPALDRRGLHEALPAALTHHSPGEIRLIESDRPRGPDVRVPGRDLEPGRRLPVPR